MIISDTHKYIFVQFPQTGCSAVAQELIAHYDGRRILYKHAQYHEFLKIATPAQKAYFSFSSIRHPMDVVVSKYFKYKSDHENYKEKKVSHGKVRRWIMPRYEERRQRFIETANADFEAFFLNFYKWPYSAWSVVNHHQMDFLMRFEDLSADFEQVLQRLNLDPVRPLPVYNQTNLKHKHFSDYYQSPEVRKRAVEIFGPYMEEWSFAFPEDWDEIWTAQPDRRAYAFVNFFRKIYWRYLR